MTDFFFENQQYFLSLLITVQWGETLLAHVTNQPKYIGAWSVAKAFHNKYNTLIYMEIHQLPQAILCHTKEYSFNFSKHIIKSRTSVNKSTWLYAFCYGKNIMGRKVPQKD